MSWIDFGCQWIESSWTSFWIELPSSAIKSYILTFFSYNPIFFGKFKFFQKKILYSVSTSVSYHEKPLEYAIECVLAIINDLFIRFSIETDGIIWFYFMLVLCSYKYWTEKIVWFYNCRLSKLCLKLVILCANIKYSRLEFFRKEKALFSTLTNTLTPQKTKRTWDSQSADKRWQWPITNSIEKQINQWTIVHCYWPIDIK